MCCLPLPTVTPSPDSPQHWSCWGFLWGFRCAVMVNAWSSKWGIPSACKVSTHKYMICVCIHTWRQLPKRLVFTKQENSDCAKNLFDFVSFDVDVVCTSTHLCLSSTSNGSAIVWVLQQCFGTATAMPCHFSLRQCHCSFMEPPRQYRGTAMDCQCMAMPWDCHGSAMALQVLLWRSHCTVAVLPCPVPQHCYESARALPWLFCILRHCRGMLHAGTGAYWERRHVALPTPEQGHVTLPLPGYMGVGLDMRGRQLVHWAANGSQVKLDTAIWIHTLLLCNFPWRPYPSF